MARDLTEDDRHDIIVWMKRIAGDLRTENDRSIVIVGAAQADACLYKALDGFLLPSPTKTDELLEGDSPLSTFSSRILACFRLGLIDDEFAKALNILRRMRNSFAHDAATVTLESGGHKDRVLALLQPLRRVPDWWNNFRKQVGCTSESSSDLFRALVVYILVRLEAMSRRVNVLEFEEPYAYVPEEWLNFRFEDRSLRGDSNPAPRTA